MRSSSQERPEETRVPLSVVFVTVGFIILIAVGLFYVLLPVAPLALPALLPHAQVPAPASTLPPLPTLMNADGEQPILLPQTPRLSQLPSEARLDEAPTALRDPVPGQPVRIVIPDLNVDAPVWEVGLEWVTADGKSFYQWQVPNAYAAGWHNSSALLGEKGNTVLNGHHNIYGEIFRDLVNLPLGAEIILYDQERAYTYRVSKNERLLERGQPLAVRVTNARWMESKPDERITLVSCWPYTDNSHRVIVVAVPAY